MITLIYGDNSYERDQQIYKLVCGVEAVDKYDGSDLSALDFDQLFKGVSLFSNNSLKIIRNLSENGPVWLALGDYLEKNDISDASLVLVDVKPDKRTKTYKLLKKIANLVECKSFSDRDVGKASAWLLKYAEQKSINLEASASNELVRRLGVDQYRLINELSRLASLGDISLEIVRQYTEETDQDTAFDLLRLAIEGNVLAVQKKVGILHQSDDPYRTFGLLISQFYALVGLVYGGDSVSTDLGIHPFVLGQLKSVSKKLDKKRVRSITDELANIDLQIKTTSIKPWLAIELGLTNIAKEQ